MTHIINKLQKCHKFESFAYSGLTLKKIFGIFTQQLYEVIISGFIQFKSHLVFASVYDIQYGFCWWVSNSDVVLFLVFSVFVLYSSHPEVFLGKPSDLLNVIHFESIRPEVICNSCYEKSCNILRKTPPVALWILKIFLRSIPSRNLGIVSKFLF